MILFYLVSFFFFHCFDIDMCLRKIRVKLFCEIFRCLGGDLVFGDHGYEFVQFLGRIMRIHGVRCVILLLTIYQANYLISCYFVKNSFINKI